MKVLSFLLFALAGIGSHAQGFPDEFYDEVSEPGYVAWVLVYSYAMYDFDVGIYGYNNTNILPGCTGTNPDKSCNFNEFINYLLLGEAKEVPFHYELTSGFSLQIGTAQQLVDALIRALKVAKEMIRFEKPLVKGTNTWRGRWKAFGKIYEKQIERGAKAGKNVALHASTLEMVMGGVTLHSKGLLQQGGVRYFKDNMKDVLWQVVRQADNDYNIRSTAVDWEATIARNPALKDPDSVLSIDVKKALHSYNKLPSTSAARTEARAIGNTMNQCIRPSKNYYYA